MNKKNYLSGEEQLLWRHIQEKDIVDSELLEDVFPEWHSAKRNKLLHSLFRKKYLQRAFRGLYYNPEKLNDYHALAFRISEGYIGLSSALRFYNLMEYEDFTMFIITHSFRKNIPLKGTQHMLRFIPLHGLYTGFIKSGGTLISTKEKTLFDCLLKPRLVGYSVIAKALYEAQPMDWKLFLSYFELTGNDSLAQRTGYLLELLEKNTKMNIPAYVFSELQKKVKTPVKLITSGKTSAFNRRWKVQDNLGEQGILPWWY